MIEINREQRPRTGVFLCGVFISAAVGTICFFVKVKEESPGFTVTVGFAGAVKANVGAVGLILAGATVRTVATGRVGNETGVRVQETREATNKTIFFMALKRNERVLASDAIDIVRSTVHRTA